MIKSIRELVTEARTDLNQIIENLISLEPDNTELVLDLREVELKLARIQNRICNPVQLQETKKHIPEDPYKKASDFQEVKAYVDAENASSARLYKNWYTVY